MKAKCVALRGGYEYVLKLGEEYEITDIQEAIFDGDFYVIGVGEEGKEFTCHLYRFDIPKETAKEYVVNKEKLRDKAYLIATGTFLTERLSYAQYTEASNERIEQLVWEGVEHIPTVEMLSFIEGLADAVIQEFSVDG